MATRGDVADEETDAVLRVRRTSGSDGAAAVVQVDEDEVVDGERGGGRGGREDALRGLEGAVERAGREVHLVEDVLHLLLARRGGRGEGRRVGWVRMG